MKRYLLFVFSMFFYSCSWFTPKPADIKVKDDPIQLPPETQEGKNTFGCLVNGQVWRNQGMGQSIFGKNLTANYSGATKAFEVYANKRIDPSLEIIWLQINKGFTGKGVYRLDSNHLNGSRLGLFIRRNGQSYCEYKTDSLNAGILEITRFDSIAPYIVSGRFSFTVATPSCDTVRVTNGRFDIQLQK